MRDPSCSSPRWMGYQPIRETHQLPLPGPLPEDLRFDMKLRVGAALGSAADLATDVAAFANAAGGVLLIGANESPPSSGKLDAYVAMTYAEANAVGDKLKRALALCSPTPIAEAKPIELRDATGYAVAINCEPYAAPPIGVAQPGQGGGEKWWAFPARRGRDTHCLRPEELATIMEPRLRRMALLLARIPSSPPANLPIARFHSRSGSNQSYCIQSVNAEASTIRLKSAQDLVREVIIPLDTVAMIWEEPDGARFHVSLTGMIVETSSRELQFQP